MSEGESPAVEKQDPVPASLPERADVQLYLHRFAGLRSAERALSCSIAKLRNDAWQKRGQRLRLRFEKLTEAWRKLESENTPNLHAVETVQNGFIEADLEVSAIGNDLRSFADDLQPAQLRSTLPALSQDHRKEVDALLDLLIEDMEGLAARRGTIEYIVTLLSTSDESGTRRIAHDPVQLTPKMQSLCERIEAECGADSQEYELTFFEAANLASEGDAFVRLRDLRSQKEELGALCFLPGVLRSIVTYNTHMANRVSNVISGSRDDDITLEDLADDAHEPATQSNDTVALDFVEPELKAEPIGLVSILDSNGASQIVEALQRRLRGVPIGSCASERIAMSLDLSNLKSDEVEILECAGPESDTALASVLLVGLLSVVFPAIEEPLLELGITRQQVHQDWAQELDQEIQRRMSAFLAANEYDSACQLADFKTTHLYTTLSSLARERRERDGIKPRTTNNETDTAKAEMIAVIREAQAEYESSGTVDRMNLVDMLFKNGAAAAAGQTLRGGLVAVASLCLLAVIGLNWINAETLDTKNLRPRELSDISRYLKTAYRNGDGSGVLVIGTIDEEWHSLSDELRFEAAQAMMDRFAEEKVENAMIYDAHRRIQIHVASGKLRRPLSAAR